MAYCVKCGAYIPDGQTLCLSCGYDPESEKQTSAASSAASAEAEELRKQLEEQRRKNQEQSKKWAEQEQKRREEQAKQDAARKAQQEQNRKWAEEEYARRKKANAQSSQTYSGYTASTGSANAQSVQASKIMSCLSYLGLLFLVPKIFAPNDSFARYHSNQGLRLFIFSLAADLLTSFGGFGWIATLARIYFIYKGMSNAVNGVKEPLPYIGTLGENWNG